MPGEIATAYVQIIPSTEGISGNLSKELGGAGDTAGKESGSKFAATFKKIIAAAGIGKVVKEALSQGMELEQNLGGAEAVFGDDFTKIVNTAQDAYKNLGASQSEYLASANKIGSLLQGSGIEQAAAVDLTTQAMQRAADVASVMGISTESAFEAITGAAKGNFTMMDNLGVAMNATTLEAYAMEQGMTDFSYSAATNAEKAELAFQMFFDKTAQYEGNFARESQETLSGSLGAMKASLSDLLANIALGNDITPYLNNLMTSVTDFAVLFLPVLSNIFTTLPSAIVTALSTLGPILLTEGVNAIINFTGGLAAATPQLISTAATLIPQLIIGLTSALPQLVSNAGQMVNAIASGISQAMPVLIGALPEIISSIVEALIQGIPILLQTGIQLFMTIVSAIPAILGALGSALGEIGSSIVSAVSGFASRVKTAAQNVFNGIVTAATNIASKVTTAVKNAITNAIDTVKGFISEMASAGSDLLLGLADGIGNAIGSVVARAKEAASQIVSSVKSFFGIASPSKLFRDEVGQFLMLGLAEGITDNTDAVSDAIDDVTMMTTKGFESNLGVNAALGVSTDAEATGGLNQLVGLVAELSDKIERLRLYLDSGELVGGITTDMDNALGNRDALTARGVA